MKYTVPQRTAVYYNEGNLLLSAAAGSGKTASLTARIVRLLIDGEAELREMLVVTYTRAAAAEMKSRIRRALSDAVETNRKTNPTIAARASRALSALSSASISTIHSFLYREMRQYFPALGMPHDTRITDTGTAETMKSDAMRDTVDDFFAKTGDDGADFIYLADVIGRARDTTAIDRELLWLADKLAACGMNERDLGGFADSLEKYARSEDGFFATLMGDVVRDCTREFAEHYRRIFSDIEGEFESYCVVAEKYGATLSYIEDWLARLCGEICSAEADYQRVRALFSDYAPPALGRLGAKNACDVSEKFKFFRDKMKKDLSALTEDFYTSGEDEAKTAARETARILRCAEKVIGEYFVHLREMKNSRSVIDYSDLETIALKLFTDENGSATEAAREVGGKFKYIFIDEYQDTNAVQDAIFRAVSQNSVRFMVGDIKQSIYRFRGAEPRVFSGYRERWAALSDSELIPASAEHDFSSGKSALSSDGRSLFMSDNFRCAGAVIDFVNMISDYTLSHGGIPYTERDALICAKNGGESAKSPVEIVLIEKKRTSSKNSEGDASFDDTVSGNPEAAYVAGRIAAMIGKYSSDGERVISPSDIAVIMRSPGSSADDYERELSVYGISSVTKTSRSITSYPSVMLCVCLLNFIDNPMRDIYAAGALCSAVFGFSLAEIIALRERAGDLPLITAVNGISADSGDDALSEKCRAAAERLERYKTVSRGMASDKLLEFLIRDTNLYSISGVRGSGEERDAIDRLCDMARAYEMSGVFGGLSGFIDYIAESGSEEDGGASSADAADSVSIMSIHSSKGLEFPVVFLAECGKRRNAADENGTVLFDDVLGLGMMIPDSGGLARCDTVLRKAVSEKIRRESVEEEMRMLYVAMTRAENRLIITGKTTDAEGEAAEAAALSEYDDGYTAVRSSKYLEWILGGAARVGEREFYVISALDSAEISSGERIFGFGSAENTTVQCDVSAEELESRFSFEYPREFLAKIPSKLTVSRLYPEILDENGEAELAFAEHDLSENDAPRPSFMTGVREGGAERGSATHLFMQFADFGQLYENGAKSELRRLTEGGFISADAAALVDLRQIERFVSSSLMDKLRRSDMVKREFRFNVQMDAADFTDDDSLSAKLSENGVKITVQGVVDCVFRDPDSKKLILIDYKTDRVTSDEWRDAAAADAAFRERHKNQLSYYKKICSRLFGEQIHSALIYSTVLGRCIDMGK